MFVPSKRSRPNSYHASAVASSVYKFVVATVLCISSGLVSELEVRACVTPASGIVLTATPTSVWEIYQGAIDAQVSAGMGPGIYEYRTPQQVRTWTAVMANAYTVMAYHQRYALDYFGQEKQQFRRCLPGTVAQQTLLADHARESFAYSFLWALGDYIPEWATDVITYATSIGVDLTACSTGTSTFGCGTDTPIGLAYQVRQDVQSLMGRDGWNADGIMRRNHNRYAFQDWRNENSQPNFVELCRLKYKPANQNCGFPFPPFGYGADVCWKGQIQQINNIFYTEHYLMPHVADSARSYHLGDSYICGVSLSYPCYDLRREGELVYRRINGINERVKSMVELFDNVWYWFDGMVTGRYALTGATQNEWQVVQHITMAIASMYESTLVVWNQKIKHGVIRPKSFINHQYEDVEIESYQGPASQTSGRILGQEWAPYVTDEPTAEFPSHIACMCSAFARSMLRTAGSSVISGNPSVTVDFVRAVGSSEIEANMPTTAQTFSYLEYQDFIDDCWESRRRSGTNFILSVETAESLCEPLSDRVEQVFDNLEQGTTVPFTTNFEDLKVVRCEQNFFDRFAYNLLSRFVKGSKFETFPKLSKHIFHDDDYVDHDDRFLR